MPGAGGAIQPGRLGHEGTADRKKIQKVALPTRNLPNISALYRVFFLLLVDTLFSSSHARGGTREETCSALLSSFARRPTHLGSVQKTPPPALVQRRDSFHVQFFLCGYICVLSHFYGNIFPYHLGGESASA